jgi:hypothetical protein
MKKRKYFFFKRFIFLIKLFIYILKSSYLYMKSITLFSNIIHLMDIVEFSLTIIILKFKNCIIKRLEKNIYPKQCSTPVKKCIARSNVVSWRKGDKNWGHIGSNISLKTASGNFEPSTTFTLLIKIYLS